MQILTFWCIDVSSKPSLPHPWFAISIEHHPAKVVLTMSASARFSGEPGFNVSHEPNGKA